MNLGIVNRVFGLPILCPRCLEDVNPYSLGPDEASRALAAPECPSCRQPIPGPYLAGYETAPPAVFGLIGRQAQGKTVFCGSLYITLDELLPRTWSGCHNLRLDEESLGAVKRIVSSIKAGQKPAPTAEVFQAPALIRLAGLPRFGDRTLVCFDTAGENLRDPGRLSRNAWFIKALHSVCLLVNPAEIEAAAADPAADLHDLLNTYLQGLSLLGGESRRQHLIVVFTMGDEWALRPDHPEGLLPALRPTHEDDLRDLGAYVRRMSALSRELREFAASKLRALNFLRAAESRFRSVEFTVTSSSGASMRSDRVETAFQPCRVVDPLLWVLEKSRRARGRRFLNGVSRLIGRQGWQRHRDRTASPGGAAPRTPEPSRW